MTQTRSGPGSEARATSTPPSATDQSSCADRQIDLALVGPDADLWALLFDGRFRLAVKCRRCGRWLTGKSKRRGIGAHCAAREAAR